MSWTFCACTRARWGGAALFGNFPPAAIVPPFFNGLWSPYSREWISRYWRGMRGVERFHYKAGYSWNWPTCDHKHHKICSSEKDQPWGAGAHPWKYLQPMKSATRIGNRFGRQSEGLDQNLRKWSSFVDQAKGKGQLPNMYTKPGQLRIFRTSQPYQLIEEGSEAWPKRFPLSPQGQLKQLKIYFPKMTIFHSPWRWYCTFDWVQRSPL